MHSRRLPLPHRTRIQNDLLPHLDSGDSAALARALWRWEKEQIGWFGLDEHWIEEPFPLEVKYGLGVWKEV